MKRRKQGELVFITGGARSGKSSFAVKLAKTSGGDVAFVATCDPQDDEMKERVRRHKKDRPKPWKTLEAGATPFFVDFGKIPESARTLLVDCFTLWTASLVLEKTPESKIKTKSAGFLKQAVKKFQTVIVVSNETGCGIVPEYPVSRVFRDVMGRVNQETARRAHRVFFVVSGIPVQLKGEAIHEK